LPGRPPESTLRFGVSLLRANPARWLDIAVEAERLGFESVWISDHLVLPTVLDSAEHPRRKILIKPTTPTFDVMVHLAALAARTSRIRLGTYVYQLALRHPFVAARAVTTLDVVSSGRVELGVGAGYVSTEWAATGLEFATRGALLDECIAVCRRLWTESAVRHDGRFYRFPAVEFEPKPVQRPHPPIHVGGESRTALRRAAAIGDGWIGMHHTPASAGPVIEQVHAAAGGRSAALQLTVAAEPGTEDAVDQWRELAIDRLIVAPWRRSRDAIAGLRRFAEQHIH